jgi:hypothetical protein
MSMLVVVVIINVRAMLPLPREVELSKVDEGGPQ